MNNNLKAIFELKALIYTIVSEILKENRVTLGEYEKYCGVTKAALLYIESNLSATLKTNQIAESLFVSKHTLQCLFKEDLKMTIGNYIDECVLIEGERLLRCSEFSVKEISDKLGFATNFIFHKNSATDTMCPPKVP